MAQYLHKPEGNMGAITSLGSFLLEWHSTYTNQRGTWVLSLVWEAPCWNETVLTQTRGEHGCFHLSGRVPVGMGQYLHKPEGNMGAVTSLGGSLLE